MDDYELVVSENEFWDPINEEFVSTDACKLVLRHSLCAVVKWECKTKRSFFKKDQLTDEDMRLYIKCMTTNGDFDWLIYQAISAEQLLDISKYIDDPMTASTYTDFSKGSGRGNVHGKIITAETFYSSMIALGIPFECENWHLNRLVALIRFCEVQNNPGKKMSQGDLLRTYADINRRNKAYFKTKG